MRNVSLRARILLLILGVAVAPLALIGWWITGTAGRSGEALLRARLKDALNVMAVEVSRRWVPLRSTLLDFAEDREVQQLLGKRASDPMHGFPESITRRFASLDSIITSVTVLDRNGRVHTTITRPGSSSYRHASLNPAVSLAIFAEATTERIGTLEASLSAVELLSFRPSGPLGPGAIIAAFDRRTGVSLLPIPLDPSSLTKGRFTIAQDDWLAERRALTEPEIDLIATAPLTPFTEPFADAAARGLWVLLAVAGIGLLAAVLLTRRMTRSLGGLVAAADAVAKGDLARRLPTAPDEIGRVAGAFNTMADSLQSTLTELSQRESVAAVGDFASELAHEVRNPLTAIRVELQILEEQLPPQSSLREAQRVALQEIDRLDRTVSGTLQLARSGRVSLQPIDLQEPLASALQAAKPILGQRSALISRVGVTAPVPILGDSGALEQLLLNLLVNAAQAIDCGGRVDVSVAQTEKEIIVKVLDNGHGISSDQLERVREPFFTTRAEGTGLGLRIAERIAKAHGGEIRIESAQGSGTSVEVRLPAYGRHVDGLRR